MASVELLLPLWLGRKQSPPSPTQTLPSAREWVSPPLTSWGSINSVDVSNSVSRHPACQRWFISEKVKGVRGANILLPWSISSQVEWGSPFMQSNSRLCSHSNALCCCVLVSIQSSLFIFSMDVLLSAVTCTHSSSFGNETCVAWWSCHYCCSYMPTFAKILYM